MVSAKKRILLITRNFPPLTGGMERLNHQLAIGLAGHYDLALIGPAGCESHVPTNQVVGLNIGSNLSYYPRCFAAAWRMLKSFRPDLIISGSGTTAPMALFAARSAKAPWICLVHGLDIIYPDWLYQRLFLPKIRRADGVIANSANTARLAVDAGVPKTLISIVHPGVSLPAMHASPEPLATALNVGCRPVLLSVGRLVPRKGIEEFIRFSLPEIVRHRPDVLFLVIGCAPGKEATKGCLVTAGIRSAIEETGLEQQVRLLGKVSDDVLAQAFALASLHVFPVLDIPGDVEGFGMVAIEAAAHGVPTVAFASGGVVDAVKEAVSGYLVPAGDHRALAIRVLQALQRPAHEATVTACLEYARGFSWECYVEKVHRQCEKTWAEASGAGG